MADVTADVFGDGIAAGCQWNRRACYMLEAVSVQTPSGRSGEVGLTKAKPAVCSGKRTSPGAIVCMPPRHGLSDAWPQDTAGRASNMLSQLDCDHLCPPILTRFRPLITHGRAEDSLIPRTCHFVQDPSSLTAATVTASRRSQAEASATAVALYHDRG